MEPELREQFRKSVELTPQQLAAVVKVVEKRLLGSELEFRAEFSEKHGILSGYFQMPRTLPRRPGVSYLDGRMSADDAARVAKYRRAMDMVSRTDIDFVVLRDDETLVVVNANNRDWSRLEPVWLIILAEVERLWPRKPEQNAQATLHSALPKKKRGRGVNTLDFCKLGLTQWLDHDAPLGKAARTGGVSPDTLKTHIPLVLANVDDKTRERWLERLKQKKKLHLANGWETIPKEEE